jgi:lysyl endopeptidase
MEFRPRILGIAALAALAAAAPGFTAPIDEFFSSDDQALPRTVGTLRDPGERAAKMLELQQRLAARQVAPALAQPVRISLTATERRQIDEHGKSLEQRYLVGVSKRLGTTVDFTRAGSARGKTVGLAMGAARGGSGGGFVWSAAVEVPGATALRLHLTKVDLPAGATLHVYNLAGHAFGPYTGRGPLGTGEFHTHTVIGDKLIVQLESPAGASRAPRLSVAEVGVMGARFVGARLGPGNKPPIAVTEASNLCSYNADCVVNAACQSSSVVATARDAVASILFQSGASYYICTGGLVADTVSTSVIPYFLTANHCISSSGEASSLETYFDYETTCNSPNCSQPYNNTGETVGATIKAHGSTSDYSLLQLSSTPVSPDGVVTYLGWLSTAVANTNNYGLYRISHPSGAPQAYSTGVVDTSKVTCGGLPRGNYIYSRDTLGATEGGSSGSPVVNNSGQIVGQLYGACGFNINDVCDAAANATVDGAFASSYPALQSFLNPGSGGCSAKGASCTANSECCSNSCKGKPGAKTCK